MADITGKKTIFFVTSPRSPHKLIDEIKFLTENFTGKTWNTETQKEFYSALIKQGFSEGSVTGDIAFKARDRINRAPKSLGLVDLKPTIQLTEAGKRFIYGKRPEEIFLRQLLKFQLSSPYHPDKDNIFNVKPYLELMRLIYDLENISKTEIALFVVQLTNVANYRIIKNKIEKFRAGIKTLRANRISYKTFVLNTFLSELTALFEQEIESHDIAIRESKDISLKKFILTKRRNHLDYADAAVRYLRATGIFTIDPRTVKVHVIPERLKDLEYILENISKDSKFKDDEKEYKKYLFNPDLPLLLTDDKKLLIEKIIVKGSSVKPEDLELMEIERLKDIYQGIIIEKTNQLVITEKAKLKTYQEYEDIIKTFDEIEKKEIADPPLFFEWNIWRAFAMLNDGDISGNFKIDDNGIPLYTAAGNIADITCKYKDFETIVEVTISSGHKQYEMEGEPVARHYGDYKKSTNKDVYCIFIAPQLSGATIAHYYVLYRTNIEKYGGKAKIIPISLSDFKQLLSNAYKAERKPTSIEIKKLWQEFASLALETNSEVEWYRAISFKTKTAFQDI